MGSFYFRLVFFAGSYFPRGFFCPGFYFLGQIPSLVVAGAFPTFFSPVVFCCQNQIGVINDLGLSQPLRFAAFFRAISDAICSAETRES